jgi:hypothetical protein
MWIGMKFSVADPCLWLMDPVNDLQDANIKLSKKSFTAFTFASFFNNKKL